MVVDCANSPNFIFTILSDKSKLTEPCSGRVLKHQLLLKIIVPVSSGHNNQTLHILHKTFHRTEKCKTATEKCKTATANALNKWVYNVTKCR